LHESLDTSNEEELLQLQKKLSPKIKHREFI